MASPRVFISSTCYDLAQVRDDLRTFINGIGWESTVSEYSFPIDPNKDVAYNCEESVSEFSNIFVLIVGSRYGNISKPDGVSITNLEYNAANRKHIPIYIFIEKKVLHALPIWEKKPNGNYTDIVESNMVFKFISSLMNSENIIHPFELASDITRRLKEDWAHLLLMGLKSRRIPKHRFWEIFRTNDKLHLITEVRTTPKGRDGGVEPRKNINGTYGLTELISFLRGMDISFEIESGLDVDEIPIQNIVSDGSYISNKLTRLVFEDKTVANKIFFQNGEIGNKHHRCIVSATDGSPIEKWSSTYKVFHKESPNLKKRKKKYTVVDRDYGVITLVKNPSDTNKWCLIASGNHGAGTYGCLRTITEPVLIEKIVEKVGFNCEFQAVISVVMNRLFDFQEPRIVDIRRLNNRKPQ